MSTPRSKTKRKRRSGGSAISTPKKRGRGAGRSSNGKAKRGGSKRVLSFAMPSANVGNGDADAEDEDADADSFDGIRSRLHVYADLGNFGMDGEGRDLSRIPRPATTATRRAVQSPQCPCLSCAD